MRLTSNFIKTITKLWKEKSVFHKTSSTSQYKIIVYPELVEGLFNIPTSLTSLRWSDRRNLYVSLCVPIISRKEKAMRQKFYLYLYVGAVGATLAGYAEPISQRVGIHPLVFTVIGIGVIIYSVYLTWTTGRKSRK